MMVFMVGGVVRTRVGPWDGEGHRTPQPRCSQRIGESAPAYPYIAREEEETEGGRRGGPGGCGGKILVPARQLSAWDKDLGAGRPRRGSPLYRLFHALFYGITEQFGLTHPFPTLCRGQDHLPLDEVALSHIQPWS